MGYFVKGCQFVCLILSMCFFVSCSSDSNGTIAGGSSDHGNAKVVGYVKDTFGNKIENATVWLLPEHFNPVDSSSHTDVRYELTDEAGYYEFKSVQKGRYVLTVEDQKKELMFTKKEVSLDSSTEISIDGIVKPSGRIKLLIDQIIQPFIGDIYIYIPGTPFYTLVDTSLDIMTWFHIAEGNHSLMVYHKFTGFSFPLGDGFMDFLVISNSLTNFTIAPQTPEGPDSINVNEEATFSTTFDWDTHYNNQFFPLMDFRFSWGDNDTSEWSNLNVANHTWQETGEYEVRAQMRYHLLDINDSLGVFDSLFQESFYSAWSDSALVYVIE
jgi:hypothetical protein